MGKIRFAFHFALAVAFLGFAVDAVYCSTLIVGPGEAYQNIQNAVDAASDWDEIVVTEGVYTENVNVDKPLALRTEFMGGDAVVVADSPSDHVFEILSDNVSIEGFTIYGSTQDSAGIFVNHHDY